MHTLYSVLPVFLLFFGLLGLLCGLLCLRRGLSLGFLRLGFGRCCVLRFFHRFLLGRFGWFCFRFGLGFLFSLLFRSFDRHSLLFDFTRGQRSVLHARLQRLLVLLKAHALNVNVNPNDMQPCHGFDRLADIFLRVRGCPLNRNAVFNDDIQVDSYLFRADLNLDALGHVPVLAHQAAAHVAHARNTFHLIGGQAGNDRHHLVVVSDVGGRRQVIRIHGKRVVRLFVRLSCHVLQPPYRQSTH